MSTAMPADLRAISFPDPDAQRRYNAIFGIDDIKTDLIYALRAAINPKPFEHWASKHGVSDKVLEMLRWRPQLFVFGGDVGTGKTELAETVGDALARNEGVSVTLFSVSLSARGSGLVGNMTQRIVETFDYVRGWGEKRKGNSAAGLIFIDEADAIAQSRDEAQMHHEDRAGVNALIRSIDDLTKAGAPIPVILATNRLDALDPAILRRAALVFTFDRPSDEQRRALFTSMLPKATSAEIARLVSATGSNGRGYGYTYSDIRQRLIPAAALRAFNSNANLDTTIIEAEAQRIAPTRPFDNRAQ